MFGIPNLLGASPMLPTPTDKKYEKTKEHNFSQFLFRLCNLTLKNMKFMFFPPIQDIGRNNLVKLKL